MRALVIYESLFGNTAAIAEAVAEGLRRGGAVEVRPVAQAPGDVAAYDLLVVGGPTHAFGLTRASTRADAQRRGARALAIGQVGLREWLDQLPPAGRDRSAAAFDTKVARPRLPGSAAAAAERRLRRLGYAISLPAATFHVDDVAGPLLDGELQRAERWGSMLSAERPGLVHGG